MPLILEKVPCVIISCEMHKKNGHASTEKKLELELNLGDHLAELEGLFPGLEQRLGFIAIAEGGPEDMTCRSAIGEVALVVGAAADKGKSEVLRIDVAKVKGKVKLHVGAKAESLRARFKCVGSLAPSSLPRVDDYVGADCIVSIKTLQTDIDDKPKANPGGKRGTRKTQIDLADGGVAGVEDDDEKDAAA